MKSKQEQKVAEQMASFLDDGEQVRSVLIARPRGWTQSAAGVRGLGNRQQQNAQADAGEAGIQLASPGAVVLTDKRLLTVERGEALGRGMGGSVNEVLRWVPLSDVDKVNVKRLLLGYVVTLKVRGSEFKLEANAAAGAKQLAQAFERSKATA